MRGLRVPIVIGVLFGVLWIAGAGSAQNGPKYPPVTPSVLPSRIPSGSPPPSTPPSTPPTTPPSTPPSVEPSRGPEPSEPPNDIPFTGADLTRFVLIGAGLTVAGTAIVRLTRKSFGEDAS